MNNGPTLSPTTVAATTTTNDTAPPAINEASILSSPSDTRAVIQWTTSEPAHTRIVFGTHQDSLNTTLTDSENISDHTITITSLMRDTNYFYRIFATDRSNNGPTPSATHTFRTSTAPDTTHPVLTNFKTAAIVKPDSTAALTVTWTTDRVATSLVEYDSVSSVGQTITDQTGKLEHSITITNLQLGQRYYYKVGSANINDLRAPPGTEISELDSVDIPTSIDTVAPTVPADLTVIPGNSAVRLRWTSSTDV
ncbi:MAG TPA: hypothetical protein DIT99_30350, partial [Candidatus Latescibacteria bacterium]|nr:hypothetical protein [Candidatus Latescibacterota bacterium]